MRKLSHNNIFHNSNLSSEAYSDIDYSKQFPLLKTLRESSADRIEFFNIAHPKFLRHFLLELMPCVFFIIFGIFS